MVCPPPMVVNCDQKIVPVEGPPLLKEIYVKPLTEPNLIGGLSQEDIQAIFDNVMMLTRWGTINQNTVEMLNKDGVHKQNEDTGKAATTATDADATAP
jgi:hypothetical protein